MRIGSVELAALRGGTPAGGWDRELDPASSIHTLLAVHTDDGLTGYGSAFTDARLVAAAVTHLWPLLIDADPLEPERTSHLLDAHTFWTGRGGSLTHTISGVDMALWDILGQATGQPIGRLLGGRHRDRVTPYSSLLADQPGPLGDRILAARDRGFAAFKIGWGLLGAADPAADAALIAAARTAAGDQARLMVDAGASNAGWRHDLVWARRLADQAADHGVEWLEEPLPPDHPHLFVELRRAARVAIAGGETLTRRHSFTPWISGGALDVVQPDVTKVGGISEQRRIMWAAEDHGVRYVGHGWNTAVGLAADLQLATASRGCDLVEYLDGSPYIDDLTTTEWQLDPDGTLPVPTAPGLGVTPDPDQVARWTGGAGWTTVR